MSSDYCMLYCKEYKAWLGLEGSKSQINDWGFDFSHIDDVSFALVSNKDDAYVFDEYGDDVEKIIDDLHYDEDIRLNRVWVESPEEKTVTGEQDLEAEDKEKLDALADEILDHNFMENIKYPEIRKMIENRDEFLWDKLLRHGHSEIFDEDDDKLLDDFISDHRDELFDLLKEKLDEYAERFGVDEEEDDDDYDEDDDDYDEDDMDESFKLRPARKNTIEEAFKLLRTPKKKINEDTKKFEDKDAEEEYFRHIQELSTDYEDPDAEEYEEDDYDEEDVEESLKEDAKFVTAATILKKDQNKIFAQTTEEGMRRMVLDILDKNKDKMKPENYSKVVKTMKNCPKSAVPSTVWTMLNPSQKVGK